MRGYYYIIGMIILPWFLAAEDLEHVYGRGGASSLTGGADSAKMNQELTLRRMRASVEGIGKFANERNLKFGLEEAERSLEYLTEHPDTFAKNGKQFSDEQLKEFIQVVFKKSDSSSEDFSALREVVDEQRAKYLPKSTDQTSEKDDFSNLKEDSQKNGNGSSDLIESDLDSKKSKSRAYNDPGKTTNDKVSNLGATSLAIPFPYEREPKLQNSDLDSKSNASSPSINSALGAPFKPNEQKSWASIQPVVPVAALESQNGNPSSGKLATEKASSKPSKKADDKPGEIIGKNETEKSKMDEAKNQDSQKAEEETVFPSTQASQMSDLNEEKEAGPKSEVPGAQSPKIENSYYSYFSDLAKNSTQEKEGELPGESSEKPNVEDPEKIRTAEQSIDYGSSGGDFPNYRSTGPGGGSKPIEAGVPSGIWLPGKTSIKSTTTSLIPNVVRAKAGDLIRRFKERFGDVEKIEIETSKLGIRLPRTLSASLLTVGTATEATARNLDSLLTLQEGDADNVESIERNQQLFVTGILLVFMIAGLWYRRAQRRTP